jgi:hypothetical protein
LEKKDSWSPIERWAKMEEIWDFEGAILRLIFVWNLEMGLKELKLPVIST